MTGEHEPPGSRSGPAPGLRPAVLVAFAGALAIYLWCAAPTVLDRDTAELQTVAITGGVAHTTGYPLFVLAGKLFATVLPGDPAFRINAMSSFFGAVVAALMVVVGVDFGLTAAGALAAAMIFGATFSFWAGALRAEVYTSAIAAYLLALWRTRVALRTRRFGDALGAGVLLGLTACGHLATALPVAVLGLMLAWRVLRERHAVPLRLALLAGAFVLGLTPYLYLVWADARGTPLDYLEHVRHVFFADGRVAADFDSPWERVRWLILGVNRYPIEHHTVGARELVRRAAAGGPLMFLFELGPVASLMVPFGLVRLWARRRADALLLAGLAAASIAFSLELEAGPLIPIFLFSGTVSLALFAGFALEGLLARLRLPARGALAALVPAMLAAALVMAPPHLLRILSYRHPIPPHGWSELDEGGDRPLRLVWRWNEPYAARDLGLATLERTPPDALVLGAWTELTTLYYFRYVLGRRPDITFQPYSYPEHLPALRIWQAEHDLSRRPVVMLTLPAEMRPHLVEVDSTSVGPGRFIYLVRTPMVHLERRPPA